MRIVSFERPDGRPLRVNPDHVTGFVPTRDQNRDGKTVIYLNGKKKGLLVRQNSDLVNQLLRSS